MIDVFFCSMQGALPIRQQMLNLCLKRWESEPISMIHICGSLGYEGFQLKRRQDSEKYSHGDIYSCADDDCFPQSEPFVEKAVEIMEKHQQFGILSLWPSNCIINHWSPGDGYEVFEDDEVMEHVSVGGIRFCRKGIVKEWPPQTGKGYDREHCEAIRAAGYKVGYFKNLKMNHLGEGYSTVW